MKGALWMDEESLLARSVLSFTLPIYHFIDPHLSPKTVLGLILSILQRRLPEHSNLSMVTHNEGREVRFQLQFTSHTSRITPCCVSPVAHSSPLNFALKAMTRTSYVWFSHLQANSSFHRIGRLYIIKEGIAGMQELPYVSQICAALYLTQHPIIVSITNIQWTPLVASTQRWEPRGRAGRAIASPTLCHCNAGRGLYVLDLRVLLTVSAQMGPYLPLLWLPLLLLNLNSWQIHLAFRRCSMFPSWCHAYVLFTALT